MFDVMNSFRWFFERNGNLVERMLFDRDGVVGDFVFFFILVRIFGLLLILFCVLCMEWFIIDGGFWVLNDYVGV